MKPEPQPTDCAHPAGGRDEDALEGVSTLFAVWMLGVCIASIAFENAALLGVAGCGGLVAVALAMRRRLEAPRRWAPTAITGLRIALTTVLALAAAHVAPVVLGAAVAIVFALDGADGALARATHSASVLGARLDAEADAFLVAVACTVLWSTVQLGPWVLIGGCLRYCYVLAVHALPSRGAVPRNRFAVRAYGLALAGLITAFLDLGAISTLAAASATAVLAWSFGRSFYWSFAGVPSA